jgi:hypothetical protein
MAIMLTLMGLFWCIGIWTELSVEQISIFIGKEFTRTYMERMEYLMTDQNVPQESCADISNLLVLGLMLHSSLILGQLLVWLTKLAESSKTLPRYSKYPLLKAQ